MKRLNCFLMFMFFYSIAVMADVNYLDSENYDFLALINTDSTRFQSSDIKQKSTVIMDFSEPVVIENKKELIFKDIIFQIHPRKIKCSNYLQFHHIQKLVFENCEFSVNGKILSDMSFDHLLSFMEIEEVQFQKCSFENIERQGIINEKLAFQKPQTLLQFKDVEKIMINHSDFHKINFDYAMMVFKVGLCQFSNNYIACSQGEYFFRQSKVEIIKNIFQSIKGTSLNPPEVRESNLISCLGGSDTRMEISGNIFYEVFTGPILGVRDISPEGEFPKVVASKNFFWKNWYEFFPEYIDFYSNYCPPNVLKQFPDNYGYPLAITNFEDLRNDSVVKKFLQGEELNENDFIRVPKVVDLSSFIPEKAEKELSVLLKQVPYESIPFYNIKLPAGTLNVNFFNLFGGISLEGSKTEKTVLQTRIRGMKKDLPAFWHNFVPYLNQMFSVYPHVEHSKRTNYHYVCGVTARNITFSAKGSYRLMFLSGINQFENCSFEDSVFGLSGSNSMTSMNDCQFRFFVDNVFNLKNRNTTLFFDNCCFEQNCLIEKQVQLKRKQSVSFFGTNHPCISVLSMDIPWNKMVFRNTIFKNNFSSQVEVSIPQGILDYPMGTQRSISFQRSKLITLDIGTFPRTQEGIDSFILYSSPNYRSTLSVENCLFYQNHLFPEKHGYKGIIDFDVTKECLTEFRNLGRFPMTVNFTNSIFQDNRNYEKEDGYRKIQYDDFDEDVLEFIHVDHCFLTNSISSSQKNMAGDPEWQDPVNGDFSLQKDSPLIDAGKQIELNSDVDYQGNLRIVDGNQDGKVVIDIGPLEYQVQ